VFGNQSTGLADVILPAETHAEKDGTITHPDGRLQRLRPSVPHLGDVRMGWQWLLELSTALGQELNLHSGPMVLSALAVDVPFYAGLTHEEIGGTGVRWQERPAASAFSAAGDESAAPSEASSRPPTTGTENGGLRLGTYRDLWSGEVPERNPSLRFLSPTQTLELAPADADRLGLAAGEQVEVSVNGSQIGATVAVRERMAAGSAFLIEGTRENNANLLTNGAPQMIEVTKAE
jgi:NADH-quinone oxidoreductase subunit G